METEQLFDWIEGCRGNDRSSQEKIYRHFYARMYSLVNRYVQDEQEIISIVNDGFLKAFMAIEKYSSELGTFQAWLSKITTNTALDHLRKKERLPLTTEINEEIPLRDDSHLKVMKPEYLQGLIGKLPQLAKSVLSLNMDGYSHKEISMLLNISELSSRWHLSQAKKQIREKLKHENIWG